MKHRSDIDGLRALAVGGVVLGHAGVPFLPAGFIGVDVFFVISGFLIGSILMSQLELGVFTLSGFYAKRVWRIFPALYVMIFVTLVAGCFLLTPHELRYLGGAAGMFLHPNLLDFGSGEGGFWIGLETLKNLDLCAQYKSKNACAK